MRPSDIRSALEKTRDQDPKVRRASLLTLCPCHVRSDVEAVWDRVFELQSDNDSGVRSIVLHHLTDGAPRCREVEVVAALERLSNDSDSKLRRRARRALSTYRRTGKIVEV